MFIKLFAQMSANSSDESNESMICYSDATITIC